VCGPSSRVTDPDPQSNCSGGSYDWATAPGPGGPPVGGAPPPNRGPGDGALEAP
jgi:hypothetical protein